MFNALIGSNWVFGNSLESRVQVVSRQKLNCNRENIEVYRVKYDIFSIRIEFLTTNDLDLGLRQRSTTSAFIKVVFVKKYQLHHVNGLTFEFLYDIAKQLEDEQSLMIVGAGKNGKDPLVFQDGGKKYRGFLEGRTQGKKYLLVLHLSNLELKDI